MKHRKLVIGLALLGALLPGPIHSRGDQAQSRSNQIHSQGRKHF